MWPLKFCVVNILKLVMWYVKLAMVSTLVIRHSVGVKLFSVPIISILPVKLIYFVLY
jgi:hypothetical protein